MKFNITKIKMRKEIGMGELMPKWWWGFSYKNPLKKASVFHPIPINFIYRGVMLINFWWNNWRGTPGLFEKIIEQRTLQIQKELSEKLSEENISPKKIIMYDDAIKIVALEFAKELSRKNIISENTIFDRARLEYVTALRRSGLTQ